VSVPPIKPHKKPKFGAEVTAKKEAVFTPGDSYNVLKAAWRINKIQLIDPYGFHALTPEEVVYIRSKLAEFEKRTWNEIFVTDKKWNHASAVSELRCPIARKWLKDNMKDQEERWSLRLSGAERIWGIFSEGAFNVLWWDPKHIIYKTEKKGT
jgi:hypothetical protein